MKTKPHMIAVIIASVAAVGSICASDQPSNLFDGYLALIEVISVEKLDPSEVDEGHVIKTGLVYNPMGKVIEVYDGPERIVGSVFPLTPPPHLKGNPHSLTHTKISFDGVISEKNLPVGARAVLTLHSRADFDPMEQNFNPFGFPDRSVFNILFAPGLGFDNAWPELYNKRLDWAEAIKRFNSIQEDDERIAYLKESSLSENPLLAVSAVHLLKRVYTQEAEEYFDEIIFAPDTSVYARLAIDHEFCLSRGHLWVNGKQQELEPILEREVLEVPEGTELLSFRKQMIGNGSWFSGRGERE